LKMASRWNTASPCSSLPEVCRCCDDGASSLTRPSKGFCHV
jgi:hypothetical protein